MPKFCGSNIFIKEYGSGAWIRGENGNYEIADFVSHLEAEKFIDAIEILNEIYNLNNLQLTHETFKKIEKIINND